MFVHRFLLGVLSAVVFGATAEAASNGVVISQVYGGGGNDGAIYRNDFIELFNRGTTPVNLNGWSIQYAPATSASWNRTNLSGTLQPGQYFLIKQDSGPSGEGASLPPADVTDATPMSNETGKVALVASTATLSGTCPANVVDFVKYGGSSCTEGVPAPSLNNTRAAFRRLNGCTDTDNNGADFVTGAPLPRNTASPLRPCTSAAPPNVVISQIYPAGGSAGATYQNDYVELYNPTAGSVSLAGWSLQYASAEGTSWQTQSLIDAVGPAQYYLIALARGGDTGSTLPLVNAEGTLNLGATAGKIALVRTDDALTGCPIGDPLLVDLVGYGSSANCREGAANAPVGNNSTAILRKNGGATDTNVNGADFEVGAPNPRSTAPILEHGPSIRSFEPFSNAPRDASITVDFSEAVAVSGPWFQVSCTMTGLHNDATVAGAKGGETWIITPNVNFAPGEQCTVTIFAAFVRDVDLNDSGTNTDTLASNETRTFTIATGAAPPHPPDVHLIMGNPSGATTSLATPNNYLMQKPEYALSYHRDRGIANWSSWHLDDAWASGVTRVDVFRPDPAVPAAWYRVLHTDYTGSGFDRGHLTPSADRLTSRPVNQATFLMTNMIPQAPDNNQGPWADLEDFLRGLLPANELYIVAGGSGEKTTLADGRITVPAKTWKVALVLPKESGDDVLRVNASTRTIAVILPNEQGIRSADWQTYLVTVDDVEQLTGYDFFTSVRDAVENAIEAGKDGVNPPGAAGQSISTDEDRPAALTLDVASAGGAALTYTIATPAHGTLSGSGASRTYTPEPDFTGTDHFTFRVHDGTRESNTAAVTVMVLEENDPPLARNDQRTAGKNSAASFAAAELTANDLPGPANESAQTLIVTGVSAGTETHGTVSLSGGVVVYTPASNFAGAASFTYTVCDNGTTRGAASPLCSAATVNVTVGASSRRRSARS